MPQTAYARNDGNPSRDTRTSAAALVQAGALLYAMAPAEKVESAERGSRVGPIENECPSPRATLCVEITAFKL
jgi:hypothetical protein